MNGGPIHVFPEDAVDGILDLGLFLIGELDAGLFLVVVALEEVGQDIFVAGDVDPGPVAPHHLVVGVHIHGGLDAAEHGLHDLGVFLVDGLEVQEEAALLIFQSLTDHLGNAVNILYGLLVLVAVVVLQGGSGGEEVAVPIVGLAGQLIVHVEVGVAAAVLVGVDVHVVPVAVQLDQVPGVVFFRVMHDHAGDVQHLHEEAEGGGVADADGVVILQHAVGVVAVGGGLGDDLEHAGVVVELAGHPVVNGLFLVVGGGHVIGDDLVQDGLGHLQRLLIFLAQAVGVAGLIGVRDLGGGEDLILAVHDLDVILGGLLGGVGFGFQVVDPFGAVEAGAKTAQDSHDQHHGQDGRGTFLFFCHGKDLTFSIWEMSATM